MIDPLDIRESFLNCYLIGHVALAIGLHDVLASAGGARIVVGSSVGHVNIVSDAAATGHLPDQCRAGCGAGLHR